MALIALPAKFGFNRVERFGLRRAGVSLRSRYTGDVQKIVYPFAVWEFKGNFIDYPEDQGAREIRAFLAALKGQENTFKLPVPGYYKNSANNGTALATTAAALVRAVSITVTNAGAGYIKAGEYFTIQDELKIATADMTAGGVIAFQPPLRAPVAIATPLVILNPYCVMSSPDDDVAMWGISAPTRHGFELEGIESF